MSHHAIHIYYGATIKDVRGGEGGTTVKITAENNNNHHKGYLVIKISLQITPARLIPINAFLFENVFSKALH